MRCLTIIFISLLISGCISWPTSRPKKTVKNPPSQKAQVVQFEEVDTNDDGNISEKELNEYNLESLQKNRVIDIKTPLIWTSIIGVLVFLACAQGRIVRFFKKDKEKK